MFSKGEAACRLGRLLNHSEASILALSLEGEETISQALTHIDKAKAPEVRSLLEALGLCVGCPKENRVTAVVVLRAIEGAQDDRPLVAPVWTAPDVLATSGELNSARDVLVRGAQSSVICSTFNFQRSSALWDALAAASARTGVNVKIYIDTVAADENPASWKPTTLEIAAEFPGALVYRTKRIEMAKPLVRNHSKFIAVDHRIILVTSANFSASAEKANVELGLKVDDPPLVRSIERQMSEFEGLLYERVEP